METSTPWHGARRPVPLSLALSVRTGSTSATGPSSWGSSTARPTPFFDQGRYYDFDAFLAKAEHLVAEGADFLDVGGVKAGPGPEVSEAEELDRVVPAPRGAGRPASTSRCRWTPGGRSVAARGDGGGGRRRPTTSAGSRDPDYLGGRRRRGGLGGRHPHPHRPRVPDPEPVYDEPVVDAVCRFLEDRASAPRRRGSRDERVMVDAGLDLGKTEAQSLELLRAHDRLAALGWPLFLSAPNKRFLGHLVGTDVDDRREASHAAHALGIALGSRILRAHDVRGARRTADVMAAVLAARRRRGGGALMATSLALVTLMKGDDEVVLRDAVRLLVDELVGDEDRSLVVEEVEVGGADEDGRDPIVALADAAQTPPFLTEHRVVVARGGREARSATTRSAPLVDYLADPLPSTRLRARVAHGQGAEGAARSGHAQAGGEQIDTEPRSEGREEWIQQHLAEAELKVDAEGRQRLTTWVGTAQPPARASSTCLAVHVRGRVEGHRRRPRAVPRRRRGRAAVGPHRRHRPGRPGQGASTCCSG